MPRLRTFRAVKKVFMQGVFVAVLTALIGFGATGVAAQGQRLWSIVIHFQYQDGFEFDYVLERGVSTENVAAALADCGRSHRTGSVVYYTAIRSLSDGEERGLRNRVLQSRRSTRQLSGDGDVTAR